MKTNKRLLLSIFWIIVGTTLITLSFIDIIDLFWSGMGAGLLGVGISQLIRQLKYIRNAEYKEHIDTEANDERNKFISMKAWSWAGYIFIMIAAVCVVIFKVLGLDDYMMIASTSVCIIVLLYWVCYRILQKKY